MGTSYETSPPASDATLPVVAGRLRRLRRQVALWFVLEGSAVVLWTALALAAVSFLLDYFFRLDASQRSFLLIATGITLLVVLSRRVVQPLSAPLSDDALILEVERRHPELAESLISAVQFKRLGGRGNPNTSQAMVEATIERGAAAAHAIRFNDVMNGSGLAKNVLLLVVAVAIMGALAAASGAVPHLRIWFERNLLLRSTAWPQDTYLRILRASEGRIRIPRGDDYTLQVEATAESRVVPERVFIDFRDGRGALAMKPTSDRRFEAVLANVIQPFQFRVRGGDERTEYVTVELVEPPALDDLQLSVTYPEYAGGRTEPLAAGKGPYFILPGSTLSLTGTGNKPLTQAALAREGERFPLSIEQGRQVTGTLSAEKLRSGQYAIELTDEEGLQARRPTTFGLRMRADREPRVRVRLIGIGGMVTSRARLPLTGRVDDDYGLTEVAVPYTWRVDEAEGKQGAGKLPLPAAKLTPPATEITFDDVLELESLQIPTGSGLTFHVAAADNDQYADEPGQAAAPNLGKSPDFSVRVVTDEELRSDVLRREKEQRQEFERLTKQQEELLTLSREIVAQLSQSPELSQEQRERLAHMPKQQKLIATNSDSVRQRLASIVVEIVNNRLEEGGENKRPIETRLTQKIVEPLAALQKEAFPRATGLAEQARRATGSEAAQREAVESLVTHQQSVLERMQQILNEMSQAEGYQEAINLVYEVEKMEREVYERTRKAKEEREKGILQGSDTSKPAAPAAGNDAGADE